MAIIGYRANVRATGDPVAFSNAPTTPNPERTVFVITNENMRVLQPDGTYTVERSTDAGATWEAIPTDAYILNRLMGEIILDTAEPTENSIRISGSYLPLANVAQASEYTYTLEANNETKPTFQNAWQQRIQTNKDITGSLSQWYEIDSLFWSALNEDRLVVLDFYADGNADFDVRCWAIMESSEISGAPDGLMEEGIDFSGTGDQEERVVVFG